MKWSQAVGVISKGDRMYYAVQYRDLLLYCGGQIRNLIGIANVAHKNIVVTGEFGNLCTTFLAAYRIDHMRAGLLQEFRNMKCHALSVGNAGHQNGLVL